MCLVIVCFWCTCSEKRRTNAVLSGARYSNTHTHTHPSILNWKLIVQSRTDYYYYLFYILRGKSRIIVHYYGRTTIGTHKQIGIVRLSQFVLEPEKSGGYRAAIKISKYIIVAWRRQVRTHIITIVIIVNSDVIFVPLDCFARLG